MNINPETELYDEIRKVLAQFDNGSVSVEQLGSRITALNFDSRFEALDRSSSSSLFHIIEDIGPDLELEGALRADQVEELRQVLQ